MKWISPNELRRDALRYELFLWIDRRIHIQCRLKKEQMTGPEMKAWCFLVISIALIFVGIMYAIRGIK